MIVQSTKLSDSRFEADKQQAERRLQEVLQRRDQMDVQLADLNRRRVVAVVRTLRIDFCHLV